MSVDHESQTPPDSGGRRSALPQGACEVLVVDDVGTVRLLLSRYVRELGHVATPAADGEEALEKLRSQPFDMVLLDVMMPGMDGFAVLERIKGDPALREIPVVMVSGLDELESAVRCIEAGADDYLTKPFEPTLLRARIRACLERKHLWDELEERYRRTKELEALRDSLTHMIVHDLRTPLTSLLTGLQSVPLLGELSEIQSELLAVATSGGETLLGMVNDLLDVSKMEAEGLTLERTTVRPEEVVDEALAQTQALARQKGLTLTTAIAPGLPTACADREKARRILVNLIGNALKFTPTGGTITVHARVADGGLLQFSVEDTGEGIPEEAFVRIFEKFGQVESRKAGRTQSTGLGLTFCKMAVEAHGGRIWVESELGKGSVFHFMLPAQAERADAGTQ